MCNYMGYRVSRETYVRLKLIEKQFGVLAALDALHSGFAYEEWSTITTTEDKLDWQERRMHWEFIPWWIKTWDDVKEARKAGIPWLNATSEKLLSSKMFRDAALKRRCLVPVTHFFEWRHYKHEGEKKENAYPYVVHMKNRDLFFMAGIWQPWTDKSTGETIDTFAIVTTQANSIMEVIHNKKKRMPTILPTDLAERWIFDDLTEAEIQEIASYQLPSEAMDAYTVRKTFRTDPDPLEPYTHPGLPIIAYQNQLT